MFFVKGLLVWGWHVTFFPLWDREGVQNDF